jgi:hypothetical protein
MSVVPGRSRHHTIFRMRLTPRSLAASAGRRELRNL